MKTRASWMTVCRWQRAGQAGRAQQARGWDRVSERNGTCRGEGAGGGRTRGARTHRLVLEERADATLLVLLVARHAGGRVLACRGGVRPSEEGRWGRAAVEGDGGRTRGWKGRRGASVKCRWSWQRLSGLVRARSAVWCRVDRRSGERDLAVERTLSLSLLPARDSLLPGVESPYSVLRALGPCERDSGRDTLLVLAPTSLLTS